MNERRSGESLIRELHAGGDYEGATTEAMRAYGKEIYTLLVALQRDHGRADDAFSLFGERLWRSMDGFAYRCSMRTWAYRIARAASIDVQRSTGRRAGRQAPLPEGSAVSALAQQIRTQTRTFMRTETKSAMQRLRERLSPEDQLLLVLRVDRDMAWSDLARVFVDGDEDDVGEEGHKREAARLRKRFQLVKKQLTKLAREQGLLKAK